MYLMFSQVITIAADRRPTVLFHNSLSITSNYFSLQSNAQIPHEEDSLDAEDIFDLEGMDSCNYMASDNEDYDSDRKSCDADSVSVHDDC